MTESVLEPAAAPAVLGHRQILIAFSGLVLAMLLAAAVVGLDLLLHTAGWDRRRGRARGNAPVMVAPGDSRHRLCRRWFAGGDVEQHHTGLRSRRNRLSVVVAPNPRLDRNSGRVSWVVRTRRAQSR